jgi:hypothetical protein
MKGIACGVTLLVLTPSAALAQRAAPPTTTIQVANVRGGVHFVAVLAAESSSCPCRLNEKPIFDNPLNLIGISFSTRSHAGLCCSGHV